MNFYYEFEPWVLGVHLALFSLTALIVALVVFLSFREESWEEDEYEEEDDDVEPVEFTDCPQCGAIATVSLRNYLESTDGPVPHVKVQCGVESSHWFYGQENTLIK